MQMRDEQVIIIGAGPCGLAAAIELQAAGISSLIIEKENIVHSITQYPTYMSFFSTPVNLEIADIPFTTASEKPSRLEALNYYRTVALRRGVRVHAYEKVTAVEPQADGRFSLRSERRDGETRQYRANAVIVATGYFDHPNMLGIPGEQLDKVSHFFREAHPYTGMNVAIIGGSNSAIDAALELERAGARVTVVYRGETYSSSIKPWVRPTFEALVGKERIGMRFASRIVAIGPGSVTIEHAGEREELANDFVLALTGFHPDRAFLQSFGVAMEDEGYPTFDDDTMASSVPGVYLAGVVASRHQANEIFIESGRFHGRKIAAHLLQTGRIRPAARQQ